MIDFTVCDINGAPLALPNSTPASSTITETGGGGSVTVRLNDRRTGQVTVDFDDPISKLITPLDTVIKARLGTDMLATGIVTRPVDQWAARRVVVPFSDPSIKLAAAFIGQRPGQSLPGPIASRPFYLEDLDQSAILIHLVNHAQSPGTGERIHGIVDGSLPASINRTREYEPGKQIWEAIRNLNDDQNGVDFQLRPLDFTDGRLVALDTFYPRQGTDKTATVQLHIGWGDESATDLEHAQDGEIVRNSAVLAGGIPDGQNTPIVARASDAASVAQYGPYADYSAASDVTVAATAQEKAAATVATYEHPPDVFTVSPTPGVGPVFAPSGAYWIGDTILVVARDQLTGRETVLAGRVIEATLTNQPNGDVAVALTLATQPAGGRTIRRPTTVGVIRDLAQDIRGQELRTAPATRTPAAAASQTANLSGNGNAVFAVDSATDAGWSIDVVGKLVMNGAPAGADRYVFAVPRTAAGVSIGGWHEGFVQIDYRDAAGTGARARADANGGGRGWFLGQTIWAEDNAISCHATISGKPGAPRTCISHAAVSPLVLDQRLAFMVASSNWEDSTSAVGQLLINFEGGLFTGTVTVHPLSR